MPGAGISSHGGRQSIWSYRYRAAGSGKLSRATIGPYPGISLADARLKADALRAGVANGENPSEAKRRAKREAPGRTFQALSDRYLTEYTRRKKKSADQDERNLNLHVLPKWKDRDYTTLRRATAPAPRRIGGAVIPMRRGLSAPRRPQT